MAPLKDITNNRVLLFRDEENIQENQLLSQRLLSNNSIDYNRSISTDSNDSMSSSRSRNIRFPPRLSLKSYTEAFCELSQDELNHSSDEECFFDSSIDSSYSLSPFSSSNSSCAGTPTRRKRLSLSTVLDESSCFKKMNLVDKNQLVDLVCDVSKLVIEQPMFDFKEVSTDVDLLLAREKKLLKNIRCALPDRVYGSTRDAVSFKRVEVHLLLFKQEVLKQTKNFFEKCLWKELFNYVIKSWKIVKHLPHWDNTSHNLHKEQLFNILASYMRKSLKVGNLNDSTIKQVRQRIVENKDVHSSIKKLLDVF